METAFCVKKYLFTRNVWRLFCWEGSILCFTGKASDLFPVPKGTSSQNRLLIEAPTRGQNQHTDWAAEISVLVVVRV